MSKDPLTVHIDKVAELLRGLGLDPVDVNNMRSVTIGPDDITVVRHRLDENGHGVIAGNDIATETVTIGIRHDR